MSASTFEPNALRRATEMSGAQLGSMMPMVDLSGGVMIFKDGSLSVGFSCQAPVCSLLPEESRSQLFEGLRTALRTVPPTANVQFYFGQESRASDIASLLQPGRATTPLTRRAIADRAATFVKGIEDGRLRTTTFDCYINLPSVVNGKELNRRMVKLNTESLLGDAGECPVGFYQSLCQKWKYIDAAMQSMFNPLNGAVVLSFEEYEASRAALLAAAESLNASLLQAGLKPTPLQSDDVLRRLYRKNNPTKFEAGLNHHPYRQEGDVPVAEHYLGSAYESGKDVPPGMFLLDGYFHRVLTLRMPPENITFPHFEALGLFGGVNRMEIVVNLTSTSPVRRVKELQDERDAIVNNKKGDSSAVKAAQIEREIAELGSGEDRLWQAQHIFVLRDKDPAELKRLELFLVSMAQRSESAELTEEIHAMLPYWMASQPGWARDRDLNRHNIYNTSQLVAMLPCFGGSRVDPRRKTGGVFETSDGSLFNIFPHDSQEFPSPNLLILGKSGSGKGVAANSLLTQLLRHDPRIIIVDIGSSYKRFCESAGGSFQEYDIRSANCRINPFDIFTGRSPDPEEIQGVVLQLGKMVAEARAPDLLKAERAAIEDALLSIVRRTAGKAFYMRDFRDGLQGLSGNKVANDLAVRLAPYVSGGSYANLFDGSTRVPTGSRITAFELQRLKNTTPELLPVVFQTIIQHVITLANNYPDDMKILVIDEAHVLLADPVLRAFVELAYRTFRKLGVSVIGISQGISDWIIEGNKTAITGNVSGILACAQSPGSVEGLTDLYNLSPNEHDGLSGLQVIPGSKSEFMAMRFTAEGRRAAVCVNRLTPIEYAMFTTHAQDIAVMNRWTMEPHSLTLTASIERFAAKYPRGVEMAGGIAREDQPIEGR